MPSNFKRITKIRLSVILILLAAVLLFFFDAPLVFDRGADFLNARLGTGFPHYVNIAYRLGLDLQGGTQLIYEADISKIPFGDKASAVEGVRDVIERRVNAFGVAEPVVQINKGQGVWRVIVELAGIKDVKEAIKMIGETPLLEFKEENKEPAREMTPEERLELNKFNKAAKDKANKALQAGLKEANFSQVVKDYTENEVGKDTAGDLGWITKDGSYGFLYEKANGIASGKVYPKVIENDKGLFVLKVNEQRENDKEIRANHILICYQGAERCDKETTKEEAKKQIDELKAKATLFSFIKLAKENSTEPGAKDSAGDLGWFKKGAMVKPFEDVVWPMEKGKISDVVETQFGYHLIYKIDERPIIEYKVAQVFIQTKKESDVLPPSDPWKSTNLTGKQLKSARVEFSQKTGLAEVALAFNDEGKELFGQITERNVGKPVAIFLDGQPISTPRVNEAIKGGEAVITGDFDIAEAKLLAQRLNAGALPVPISLVSQQTIGASLGSESLKQSLNAGLFGFILVILFMILYYRLPGALASIALIIYGVLVLFIFKSIPVTLTLAGIAGFVLSVGMAVDANVLIFERMKEELRVGKPLGTALDEGFKRAWPSIRDGNLTTLITCLILMFFSTGMIKGFAVTLTIGVLMSMFSALVITKNIMLWFVAREKPWQNLWWFGLRK
ncbi:protein translocase subunit SecD [Candidatus Falkowbacteria bacterium]|nr:protein translocase subunit SecD [Candidatus Falkowbacteria bacterium]